MYIKNAVEGIQNYMKDRYGVDIKVELKVLTTGNDQTFYNVVDELTDGLTQEKEIEKSETHLWIRGEGNRYQYSVFPPTNKTLEEFEKLERVNV